MYNEIIAVSVRLLKGIILNYVIILSNIFV